MAATGRNLQAQPSCSVLLWGPDDKDGRRRKGGASGSRGGMQKGRQSRRNPRTRRRSRKRASSSHRQGREAEKGDEQAGGSR